MELRNGNKAISNDRICLCSDSP